MQTLSLMVGAYGAAVATYLGYLTYRRERHRVRLRFRIEAGDGPPGLAVYVVNLGIRAVTIRNGGFFWTDQDGYIGPDFRSGGQLPAQLSDGDELRLWIAMDDTVDGPDGFVVEDTTGHRHPQPYPDGFGVELTRFRRWLDEAS